MYDVCIIGAGIIGCSIARELAKYKLKICMLEKNEDVGAETTKANSGIVHGGYAEKFGSVKAQFSRCGNQMYHQLNSELHFGFAPIGSLVVGFNAQDNVVLQELFANGKKNGVTDLELIDGDYVKKLEPNLNQAITKALYCPSAGVTSPYEFAIALAENAIANGVSLKLNSEVTAIKKTEDYFVIHTENGTTLKTKIIINAAGLYADDIAELAGCREFKITPRQGQYLLLDKDEGALVNRVIFQTPSPISKGILVTKTYHGNLLIGPDAEEVTTKDYVDTAHRNAQEIIATAKKSLPHFDLRKVITSFAGNRAISDNNDFIIGESSCKGFINVAGISSPGLTAAPAIALRVVEIVAETGCVKLLPNLEFNPSRRAYKTIANMPSEELNSLIQAEPKYGCVVCRCETVSEGEVCDALSREIPINSLDAIKRRTRAGMGRCQGGFCTPKLLEIIENELHLSRDKITKKGQGSELVMGRTKAILNS